ncbi:MAG TPA: cytochrome P460 family protein [Bryobacteraceae bacterium]|nr:cytochrome P460 family protein [Bryobacteraceae bacterium]
MSLGAATSFAVRLSLFALACCAAAQPASTVNPCPNAKPVPAALRIPADLPVKGEPFDFEKQLRSYFGTLGYRELGWCQDKWVRDTGPYLDSTYYGTHPAARIFYSPEVIAWLLGGRKGKIADGAVIIKEQYAPPAANYWNQSDDNIGCPNDWTFMIKKSSASQDGWFWGEVWYPVGSGAGMIFTDNFQYPNAGFGLYCLRCHASAASEYTFSDMRNMKGTHEWPLTFRVDNSWMNSPAPWPGKCNPGSTLRASLQQEHSGAHDKNADVAMLKATTHITIDEAPGNVQIFPPETFDKTISTPGVPPEYITSDQCTGCHSAYTANQKAFGPNMFIGPDINISPYGEWRWSPMGLAGRDPIFYAQLDGEFAGVAYDHGNKVDDKQLITNTCLNCHGAMGYKTFHNDPKNKDKNFDVNWVYDRNNFYGGLSRDGISCAVCHHIAQPADMSLDYFLKNLINGNYEPTKPDTVLGPFEKDQITQYPMKQSLGINPDYKKYITTSRMCGHCHTIELPVLDSADPKQTSIEQATYLEWLNSDFQDEYGKGKLAKTCQECHMPTSYTNAASGISVPVVMSRMANVEDITYPAADNLATPSELNVRYRTSGFVRHEMLGLNGFMLQTFQQYRDQNDNNPILGVRLYDYMSNLKNDLPLAIANVVQQGGFSSAEVKLPNVSVSGGKLTADVEVDNLVGHRFPSGVGFRRAFIEFDVYQSGKLIFSSGRTSSGENGVAPGTIVDFDGKPLPTESFAGGQYQPHFDQQHPIRSSSQVQIYEELVQNAQKQFTTLFTQRDNIVKDNRILPQGWTPAGPKGVVIPHKYLESTFPINVGGDPQYANGSGKSIVRYVVSLPAGATAQNVSVKVSVQYQAEPPYFLAARYQTNTQATQRLQYLNNNLKLDDTPFAGWKLTICSNKWNTN